jgi:hypothetical protein
MPMTHCRVIRQIEVVYGTRPLTAPLRSTVALGGIESSK